ncbi:MAG TPA: AGE family epimerase/isomerase, partial [Steroidobacteraceae bacterium]|nr:AGE family epimerase/isomerase [Steroidobacteraceae bacterium]
MHDGAVTDRESLAARMELARLNTRLRRWLAEAAYPRWADRGVDAKNGGFVEVLGQNGVAMGAPLRARVHPRQVYAFAQAARFGWHGDAVGIIRRGIDYFLTYYR